MNGFCFGQRGEGSSVGGGGGEARDDGGSAGRGPNRYDNLYTLFFQCCCVAGSERVFRSGANEEREREAQAAAQQTETLQSALSQGEAREAQLAASLAAAEAAAEGLKAQASQGGAASAELEAAAATAASERCVQTSFRSHIDAKG